MKCSFTSGRFAPVNLLFSVIPMKNHETTPAVSRLDDAPDHNGSLLLRKIREELSAALSDTEDQLVLIQSSAIQRLTLRLNAVLSLIHDT